MKNKQKGTQRSLEQADITLKASIAALRRLKFISKELQSVIDPLNSIKGSIFTTGIGKSGFIAMKMAATFASFGIKSHFIHPTDALHGDSGLLSKDDAIIAFSFSGSSPELIRTIKHIRSTTRTLVIAITGKKVSTLTHIVDHSIITPVSSEGSPHNTAPMASTLAALAAADMLVSAIVVSRDIKFAQFARTHPAGQLGLKVRAVSEIMTRGKNIPLSKNKAPLREAIAESSLKGFGVTGVIDSASRLVGIITDGDIRRFLMHRDSLQASTAAEAMTTSPKTVSKDDTLETALLLMEKHKITNLFVIDRYRRPIGIIHIHQILDL